MTIREYIEQAIKENKTITIKYQKYDGTFSTRKVSNIAYSDEYGSDYIKGYCHLRNEDRTFKISRIREVDGITDIRNTRSSSSYTTSYSPSYSHTSYTSSRPPKRNEGCYIATMAYGDYDHPQVMILRNYRDHILSASFVGRFFIHVYYMTSPKLVLILRGHETINHVIRLMLDKIVKFIRNRYCNYYNV